MDNLKRPGARGNCRFNRFSQSNEEHTSQGHHRPMSNGHVSDYCKVTNSNTRGQAGNTNNVLPAIDYSKTRETHVPVLPKLGTGVSSKITFDSSVSCAQCEELPERWFCKQCSIALCDRCVKGHLKIPLCRDHTITPLTNYNMVDKCTATKPGTQCPAHHLALVYSCSTCQEVICRLCKVQAHSSHIVEDMDKAFDGMMQTFSTSDQQVEEFLWDLLQRGKSIDSQINECHEQFTACKDAVSNRAKHLIVSIQEQNSKLITELALKESEEIDRLANIKHLIEEDIKKCADRKLEIDTKKVALVTNTCIDLNLSQVNFNELKSLTLDTIEVSNPNFLPFENKNVKCTNLMGTIRFTDSSLMLKPKVPRQKHRSLPDMFKEKPKCIKEIKINYGSSFHISLVGASLWVPVHGEDCVYVYSAATGQLQETIQVSDCELNGDDSKIFAPRAVTQINDNSVLVACDTGIFLLCLRPYISTQIAYGQFCGVTVNAIKTNMCAIDYNKQICIMYSNENAIRQNDAICSNGTSKSSNCSRIYMWTKRREFVPRNCKVDQYASVMFVQDNILVCPGGSHVLQRYTAGGEFLEEYGIYGRGEPGQLWGPSLCAADTLGNILIADVNNKRLQILDTKKKWSIIYVEELTYPFDIEVTDDGFWGLSQHNGSKYKLMKYVFASNKT